MNQAERWADGQTGGRAVVQVGSSQAAKLAARQVAGLGVVQRSPREDDWPRDDLRGQQPSSRQSGRQSGRKQNIAMDSEGVDSM